MLDKVSLELRNNEIVSLLGRSGSGKSTLLRIISGLMPATGGTVSIDGEEVTGPARQSRDGVPELCPVPMADRAGERGDSGSRRKGLLRSSARRGRSPRST